MAPEVVELLARFLGEPGVDELAVSAEELLQPAGAVVTPDQVPEVPS
ncbi:hypothetical protein [Streptomyces sp. NPDC056785]